MKGSGKKQRRAWKRLQRHISAVKNVIWSWRLTRGYVGKHGRDRTVRGQVRIRSESGQTTGLTRSIQHPVKLCMSRDRTFEITEPILFRSPFEVQIIHLRDIPPSTQQWLLPVLPKPRNELHLPSAEVFHFNLNGMLARLGLEERAALARHPEPASLAGDGPGEWRRPWEWRARPQTCDERSSGGDGV